jgi:hypothetical protein
MKDLFDFVKWQWSKFEGWQKCWIISSAFFGAAMVSEPPYVFYLSLVPMTVIFGFLTKWLIWDGTKSQWQKYKKEKEGLFDTIRDSETNKKPQ